MSITLQKLDCTVTPLNAISGVGGTATVTYTVPTDVLCVFRARVLLVFANSSHLAGQAGLIAEYVIGNDNGTLTVPAAITGSANPNNSGGLVSAGAEASDINAVAGNIPPSASWGNAGTNAVLTVTNNFASAVDAVVFLEVWQAKNV